MIGHDGAGNCVPSQPGGECVFYYLHDALGSVIGLSDSTGELVERYTYDPYGRPFVERWDPMANGGAGDWAPNLSGEGSGGVANGLYYSAFGNPFMWTGQRYDAAVALYAFLFRTYSPALGRWLQRDPVGYAGRVSLYEYVMGHPLHRTDPLGLSPGFSSWDVLQWIAQEATWIKSELYTPAYRGLLNAGEILAYEGRLKYLVSEAQWLTSGSPRNPGVRNRWNWRGGGSLFLGAVGAFFTLPCSEARAEELDPRRYWSWWQWTGYHFCTGRKRKCTDKCTTLYPPSNDHWYCDDNKEYRQDCVLNCEEGQEECFAAVFGYSR